MVVRDVQLMNALGLMIVTPSGIVMLVSALQLRKAKLPMIVTFAGIVMLVSLKQSLNVHSSMDV